MLSELARAKSFNDCTVGTLVSEWLVVNVYALGVSLSASLTFMGLVDNENPVPVPTNCDRCKSPAFFSHAN